MNETVNVTLYKNSPYEGERRLWIGVTALLVPLIFTGNTLVIVSYKSNRRLHTRTYTFLVSLAVSDFIVGVVNIPMWINCMAHYEMCYQELFKFIDLFGAYASILHLTTITIERYVAICRPYFHERLSSRFHKGTLVFVWTFSLAMAAFSWYHPTETHKQTYNCLVFILGFILPVTIIVSMYVGIFRAAKSLLRRQQKPYIQGEGERRKRLRDDHKVAVTVAVICGFFIVAWLPFFSLSIIVSFCPDTCVPTKSADVIRMVAVVKILHYGNSMVNPIVYAFRDKEMRDTFLRILRIKICWQRCTSFTRETAKIQYSCEDTCRMTVRNSSTSHSHVKLLSPEKVT